MILVEDLTALPEGSRVVGDGFIGHCPRCGRNGVRRLRHDGSLRFVHVREARMFGDGLKVEPKDFCTITQTAGAA
jgi:hypothetical protein